MWYTINMYVFIARLFFEGGSVVMSTFIFFISILKLKLNFNQNFVLLYPTP